VRSLGAKRRAARRWTNYGQRPLPSLVAAIGLADEDEVPVPAPPTPPASRSATRSPSHFWAHDDDEERVTLNDAIRLSEAALRAELRRERDEMEAAIAAVEAAKRAEREAAIAVAEAAELEEKDVIVPDD
jgi:hypothetical protein